MSPKVIAEMNDYQIKIVKIEGDFVWHSHKDTDEVFIVLEGSLRIDFKDGSVNLSKGEMYVISKGKEHKPYAKKEAKMLLIEPKGILNVGTHLIWPPDAFAFGHRAHQHLAS
jgi:mannose-6-phosphate isomerase-like protein (cupin superfamily)